MFYATVFVLDLAQKDLVEWGTRRGLEKPVPTMWCSSGGGSDRKNTEGSI